MQTPRAMSKIGLVIQREYITRVKKRSFIIMSLLGPVLFAALMIIPVWLMGIEDNEVKRIGVIEYDEFNKPVPDSLMISRNAIPETKTLKFEYLGNLNVETVLSNMESFGYYAVVKIPNNIPKIQNIFIYSNQQPSLGVTEHIKGSLEDYWFKLKLRKYDVSVESINKAHVNIRVNTIKITDKGEVKTSVETSMVIGYVSGMLTYLLIFIFGVQIMRGVIEEKTNRIIEVIISSIKPRQLMMGKIIGLALVGLTQFLIWITFSFGIVKTVETYSYHQKIPQVEEITQANSLFDSDMGQPASKDAITKPVEHPTTQIDEALKLIQSINFVKILLSFFFYFIFGYLLYAAIFAAVGSAVDSEADTQQFMLPVSIPLILGILTMSSVISNPEGPVAFWFSMIPLTSPIVMMARIPFEIPNWQIILSLGILVISFVLVTLLAAKIYRTGILMYGKKPSFKEMFKWLRYKN